MSDNNIIFSGEKGCVTLTSKKHNGLDGILFKLINPETPIEIISFTVLEEINKALDVIENDKKFKFVIFYGGDYKICAGADVKMFSGGIDKNTPDYDSVLKYLLLGANLDLRIKKLSKKIKTVSIMKGERFGGSVEWTLMPEYCVASSDTGLQFSEVNIGLIPGWSGILNICLKSENTNALYLGTTGTRIDAQQIYESSIADSIAEPEKLMDTALSLATTGKSHKNDIKRLASEDEIFKVLSERLNVHKYERLRDEVKKVQSEMDPKEFSKYIDKKLNQTGKPCAPLAVESVFGLVAKYGSRLNSEDLELIEEMGKDEAQRCLSLMKTYDREKGINSILKARENPLNKIPLFNRN